MNALHGTRKAGQTWQELIYQTIVDGGFTVMEVVANTFFRADDNILITCHGDDFLACGDPQSLDKLDVFLANHFEIKLMGKVGPGSVHGASS